jgi:uncharacterized membrane-anchored protein
MAAPWQTRRRGPRAARRALEPHGEISAREAEHRGRARLGKRTKLLVKRLKAGDIAVLEHQDIDRVAADDLVAAGVRCVLNVCPSSSGRYPNPGPKILVDAGVHLVDLEDAPLFDRLSDGDRIVVSGGRVMRGDELVAEGRVLDREAVQRAHEQARNRIGEALEAFAENTIEHIREERELLAGRIELPELRTKFRDRPALIVVRGVDHQKDLRILRPYLRDVKPVLVAVDGGADALLSNGFVPDIIVGDMDSAGDEALVCGAELVVHAYPDGRAPGRDRLDRLGLTYKVVPAPATSEDVAMLIAAEKGASLLVAVGSHFNLVEFLDKARNGMSSTFLTRLRVGEILVDAKGVSRLYRPSAGRGPMIVVTLAAVLALAVVVVTSPTLGPFLDLVWLKVQILLGLK